MHVFVISFNSLQLRTSHSFPKLNWNCILFNTKSFTERATADDEGFLSKSMLLLTQSKWFTYETFKIRYRFILMIRRIWTSMNENWSFMNMAFRWVEKSRKCPSFQYRSSYGLHDVLGWLRWAWRKREFMSLTFIFLRAEIPVVNNVDFNIGYCWFPSNFSYYERK